MLRSNLKSILTDCVQGSNPCTFFLPTLILPFPMFVDPRYEDEAIAALMEEALTEDSEETKFDVEQYFNSNIDY